MGTKGKKWQKAKRPRLFALRNAKHRLVNWCFRRVPFVRAKDNDREQSASTMATPRMTFSPINRHNARRRRAMNVWRRFSAEWHEMNVRYYAPSTVQTRRGSSEDAKKCSLHRIRHRQRTAKRRGNSFSM